MDSGGITRASSDGLKLAGPGGRSILLKAGSTETQGAYSLLKFTAPPGSPLSTHHVHPDALNARAERYGIVAV
jgi:hypothetical protein